MIARVARSSDGPTVFLNMFLFLTSKHLQFYAFALAVTTRVWRDTPICSFPKTELVKVYLLILTNVLLFMDVL